MSVELVERVARSLDGWRRAVQESNVELVAANRLSMDQQHPDFPAPGHHRRTLHTVTDAYQVAVPHGLPTSGVSGTILVRNDGQRASGAAGSVGQSRIRFLRITNTGAVPVTLCLFNSQDARNAVSTRAGIWLPGQRTWDGTLGGRLWLGGVSAYADPGGTTVLVVEG